MSGVELMSDQNPGSENPPVLSKPESEGPEERESDRSLDTSALRSAVRHAMERGELDPDDAESILMMALAERRTPTALLQAFREEFLAVDPRVFETIIRRAQCAPGMVKPSPSVEKTPDTSSAKPTLHPGSRLDEWEIVKAISVGEASEVYELKHRLTGHQYAAKLLPSHAGCGARNQFLTELDLSIEIADSNFVRCLARRQWNGHEFGVFELAAGSLVDRLDGGSMAPPEAVTLLLPIARALAALHQRGVVHRDLTPANILLTDEGRTR